MTVVEVPEGAKFCGATVFCPHPTKGTSLYVSRRGSPEKLGGVPGGKVDPGETYEQTAEREFFEETGYRLARLSPAELFHGFANKSGAYCYVFLGALSEEDWERIPEAFEGPEGLVVRVAPWEGLEDGAECEFADFNRQLFSHIRQSKEAQGLFIEMGLEHPLKLILQQ